MRSEKLVRGKNYFTIKRNVPETSLICWYLIVHLYSCAWSHFQISQVTVSQGRLRIFYIYTYSEPSKIGIPERKYNWNLLGVMSRHWVHANTQLLLNAFSHRYTHKFTSQLNERRKTEVQNMYEYKKKTTNGCVFWLKHSKMQFKQNVENGEKV